jgi:hypothetical protein
MDVAASRARIAAGSLTRDGYLHVVRVAYRTKERCHFTVSPLANQFG